MVAYCLTRTHARTFAAHTVETVRETEIMGSPDMDRVVKWVEKNRDTLPTTLAELSTYPTAFRRVIINAVPLAVQVRLWQDHVATFLEPAEGLSPEQQAFVRDAIAQFPEMFGSPTLQEKQAKATVLETRARTLFTHDQGARMFGMVGPPEPQEGLPDPPGF